MRILLSINHAFMYDHYYVTEMVRQLDHLDYNGLELCHESTEKRHGMPSNGGIDDWVQYSVLSKLNNYKEHRSDVVESMRQLFGKIKSRNGETSVWSHELWVPSNILEVYPELATSRGDINLAHPILTDFVKDKYAQFFKAVPEVDTIVLTLTEVSYSVFTRFDNDWLAEQCLDWLIRTVYGVCTEYGKTLVIRPFSPNAEDYAITRRIIKQMPTDVQVMLKTDPFDWNPFLPVNPELEQFPARQTRAEFSISGEFYGGSLEFPVVTPEYFRERLDKVRSLGIKTVVARIDRNGRSAMIGPNRHNVELFIALCHDSRLDAASFLENRLSDISEQPRLLAELLLKLLDLSLHINYVNGNLTFQVPFGGLEYAQRFMLFYLFRPNHSLHHCDLEWAILDQDITPTRKDIIEERSTALMKLRQIKEQVQVLAPNDLLLNSGLEKLCDFAQVYLLLATTILEYIKTIEKKLPESPFYSTCDTLCECGQALAVKYGSDWLCDTPLRIERFTKELRWAFHLERTVRRLLPGLEREQLDKLEDYIFTGYPGESHNLRKHTHGSFARMTDQRCYREAETFFEYSLTPSQIGNKIIRISCYGEGQILVQENDDTLASLIIETDSWETRDITLTSDGSPLTLRVVRRGHRRPALEWVYLLSRIP